MRFTIVGNTMAQIEVCAAADMIAALGMSPELTIFRSVHEQQLALIDIARHEDCCVSLAVDDGELIAYAAFHPPTAIESWGDDTTGKLIELGAVEVDPSYRGQRLAGRVLEASFAQGRFEHTVVFATMYVWHYDLKRSGLTEFQYKRMLEKLYNSVGLIRMPTSDSEVRSHPANELMVRIGQHAPAAVIEEFHRLRTRPYLPLGFR